MYPAIEHTRRFQDGLLLTRFAYPSAGKALLRPTMYLLQTLAIGSRLQGSEARHRWAEGSARILKGTLSVAKGCFPLMLTPLPS